MSDREMRRLFDQVEKEERLEKLSVTYGESMKEIAKLKQQISNLRDQRREEGAYASLYADWISHEGDMSPNKIADRYYADMVGGARP